MPAFSSFTGCCGADIGFGFTDPDGTAGYEIWANPNTGVREYKKDEFGKMISTTGESQFRKSLETQKKAYSTGGRMFCCILTDEQLAGNGKKWLEILKSEGFEFVRRWTNANHNDAQYLYLFVLCTDVKGRCNGDFTVPPPGWDAIEVKPKVLEKPAVKKSSPAPPVPAPRQAPRMVGGGGLGWVR